MGEGRGKRESFGRKARGSHSNELGMYGLVLYMAASELFGFSVYKQSEVTSSSS